MFRLGLGAVAGRGEIANDRLEHVDERHETLHGAKFIGDDRDVFAGLLKALEQLDRRKRLRHKQRRQEEIFQRRRQPDRRVRPERFYRDHADDRVALRLIHWEIRVAAGHDFAPVGFLGVVEIEKNDLRPRRHEAGDGQLIEREHAFDHLFFGALKHARVQALFHEGAHFVFADVVGRRTGFQPDEFYEELGAKFKQPQQRRRQPRQAAHRTGEQRGDFFRMREPHAFRHELAKNQHERRQPGGDDHEREQIGVSRPFRPQRREPLAHFFRQMRPGEHAREHAREREPKFYKRQKSRGVLRERERLARADVTLSGEFAEFGLFRRDNGCLGHREHAIGQHEQTQNNKL